MQRRILALVALATAAGCREPTSVSACSGTVEMTVATASQPIFSWSPRCGMSSVTVMTAPATPGAGSAAVVWGFTVPEQAPVGPAVVYGVAPAGATVWKSPETLNVGTRYRVLVAQTVGQDVLVASGETTFLWFPPD